MDGHKVKTTEEIEKGVDWAYYHLIALDYVERKFEASKIETTQLTSASNKDPDKYKKAYQRLRYITDRAQKLIR